MAKLKLEVNNIKDYLKSLGVFKNVDWGKVKVSEVTEHTNVNYVYNKGDGSQIGRVLVI